MLSLYNINNWKAWVFYGQGLMFFTSKTYEMLGNFTDWALCFFYIINMCNDMECYGQFLCSYNINI